MPRNNSKNNRGNDSQRKKSQIRKGKEGKKEKFGTKNQVKKAIELVEVSASS